jgi:hypothetical protein
MNDLQQPYRLEEVRKFSATRSLDGIDLGIRRSASP